MLGRSNRTYEVAVSSPYIILTPQRKRVESLSVEMMSSLLSRDVSLIYEDGLGIDQYLLMCVVINYAIRVVFKPQWM